jgi:NADPH:quinone reductase-like Zn-dependent oxidoreductase
MRVMAFGAIMSMTGNKKISGMMAKPNSGDLTIIKDLIEKGKISPVIDRKYPFQELPEAMRYLEEGHARGKIIVSIV